MCESFVNDHGSEQPGESKCRYVGRALPVAVLIHIEVALLGGFRTVHLRHFGRFERFVEEKEALRTGSCLGTIQAARSKTMSGRFCSVALFVCFGLSPNVLRAFQMVAIDSTRPKSQLRWAAARVCKHSPLR